MAENMEDVFKKIRAKVKENMNNDKVNLEKIIVEVKRLYES